MSGFPSSTTSWWGHPMPALLTAHRQLGGPPTDYHLPPANFFPLKIFPRKKFTARIFFPEDIFNQKNTTWIRKKSLLGRHFFLVKVHITNNFRVNKLNSLEMSGKFWPVSCFLFCYIFTTHFTVTAHCRIVVFSSHFELEKFHEICEDQFSCTRNRTFSFFTAARSSLYTLSSPVP